MSDTSRNPVVTSVETWRCQRREALFDSARTGRSPMNWDVVVVRLSTGTDLRGHATALAARSSVVTQAYLHEIIAPVVLGRPVSQREAIWHELWAIDRYLAFFPVYLPGPSMWRCGPGRAGGRPSLYQFIGECRTSLPAYASSLFMPDVDEYVQQMRASPRAALAPTRPILPDRGGRTSSSTALCAPPGRITC
jgi:L-alanine-DL-glutamate epimerase-like enolase superfamily enzyme